MLSSRVDLTDNRDFGGEEWVVTITPERIDELYMSRSEWERLQEWERIFGKCCHENARFRVFELKRDINMCERCGKVIKMPWKKHYWLCETCDYIVTTNNTFIPWKPKSDGSDYDSRQRRIKQDLFHLR